MEVAIDSIPFWAYLGDDPERTRRIREADRVWVPLPVVAEA